MTRLAMLCVIALATGCGRADSSENIPPEQVRIRSTLGFSLLPPPGTGWTEEFKRCQIHYSKKTDPDKVSFFAIANECKLDFQPTSQEDLIAFVSKKKDEFLTDERYTNISTSFQPATGKTSCVRYRMVVNDNRASNKGRHAFLLLKVAGRFCTHPENPGAAVDLAYSIRHVPGYDASKDVAEGEAFLDSLRFEAPASPQAGPR